MIRKFISCILVTHTMLQIMNAQQPGMVSSLKKHVYTLASDSLEGRGFGFTTKLLAIDYITGEFESAGLIPFNDSYIQTFIHHSNQIKIEGFNIVGIIEGSDPVLKSEYIVIGAHFDHLGYQIKDGNKIIYNGADDNASGVASIIEISRKLNESKELLKRSVIIAAFDGEEIGLVGSDKFLSEEIIDPGKIKLMFSLDMVGMYGDNGGVEFNGMNSLEKGKETLQALAEKKQINIKKTGGIIEMRTDTWSFAKKDIPAIHVFTGETSPYHKPEDDSYLLDYDGMAKITEFMVDFIQILSNTNELALDKQVMKKSTDPIFRAGYSSRTGSSNFKYKNDFFNAKSMFTLESGLVTQFKISKNFILQPELVYSTTASKSQDGNIRFHSVIPVFNLLVTTKNSRKDFPFAYFLVGGYYSYHFAGKLAGEKIDFKSTYNQHGKGINFGIGFQVLNYQIDFTRRIGMTDILQDNEAGKVFNNCSYFSVVYFF